jgi:hypothetical protein
MCPASRTYTYPRLPGGRPLLKCAFLFVGLPRIVRRETANARLKFLRFLFNLTRPGSILVYATLKRACRSLLAR